MSTADCGRLRVSRLVIAATILALGLIPHARILAASAISIQKKREILTARNEVHAAAAMRNKSSVRNPASARANAVPDSDAHGIPDGLEVILGVSGWLNHATNSALDLKVMKLSQ